MNKLVIVEIITNDQHTQTTLIYMLTLKRVKSQKDFVLIRLAKFNNYGEVIDGIRNQAILKIISDSINCCTII